MNSFSKEINLFQFSGTGNLKEYHSPTQGFSIYRSPGTVEAGIPSVPELALSQ